MKTDHWHENEKHAKEPDVEALACTVSPWETEARKAQVHGQP